MFVDRPLDAFLERAALHVEALNLALADIPPEKVRLHVCWGNWDGPHLDDVELAPLLPILYEARRSARSASPAPTRATSTSGASSGRTGCPTTWR